MAVIPVTGIDRRNADNAHAWGDDETDVWIGINTLGTDLVLPRNSAQATAFVAKMHPLAGWPKTVFPSKLALTRRNSRRCRDQRPSRRRLLR